MSKVSGMRFKGNNLFVFVFVLLGLSIPCVTAAQGNFLTSVQVLKDGVDGVDGLNGVNSIAISPDGKHLYAASEGDFSLAFFRRNTSDGQLTFVELYRDDSGDIDGLDGAKSVVISPDGEYVYAGGRDDRAVSTFSRNITSGKLTFIQMFDLGQYNSGDVVSTIISPDARDLLISTDEGQANNGGYVTSAIWQSRLDPNTGKLTDEGEIYQDDYQVDDLGGLIAMAMSPDGKHLYATASFDNALVVFSRNASDGLLTFVESKVHREDGDDGLAGPISVFLSPNGSHVYVIANSSRNIATYDRNPITGSVEFEDVVSYEQHGLIAPKFGVINPFGSYVFVVNRFDDVGIFTRENSTGRLTFRQKQRTLYNSSHLAISPDGVFLYVSSNYSDGIEVFKTAEGGNPQPNVFQINAGLNGSWYYPGTDGQGFFIDVFPDIGQMFVAWFTFDTEHPDESVTANLGHPGQRWLTAQGEYFNNQAVLDVYMSGGGLFDTRPPIPEVEKDGTLTVEFEDCKTGTVTYDIPSIGRQGVVPIQRIREDNVLLCESLDEVIQATQ